MMTELEKVLTEIAHDLEMVEKKINTMRMLDDKDLSMFEGRILGLDNCFKYTKSIRYFLDKISYLNHLNKEFKEYTVTLGELNE
jgi:hypothetical protein